MHLLDCRDPERFDIWFHSLYQLARTINPHLSAADGKRLWERVGAPPCGMAIARVPKTWIELSGGVAGRDAARMAGLAEQLLGMASDLPTSNRQYLVAAGMTGYLAQGQRDKAAALWTRYPKDVDGATDLDLRLLYAHAFMKIGSD